MSGSVLFFCLMVAPTEQIFFLLVVLSFDVVLQMLSRVVFNALNPPEEMRMPVRVSLPDI